MGLPDDTGRGAAGFFWLYSQAWHGVLLEIRQGFGISNDLLRRDEGSMRWNMGAFFWVKSGKEEKGTQMTMGEIPATSVKRGI